MRTNFLVWLIFISYVYVPAAQTEEKFVVEQSRVLEGDHQQTLWQYLLAQCDQLDLQRAERLNTALETPDTLKQHLQYLQQSYQQLLGDFPLKTPLNPMVTGQLIGEGFRIEKVLRRRINKKTGEKEIYVKWKGYNKNFNQWIPLKNEHQYRFYLEESYLKA